VKKRIKIVSSIVIFTLSISVFIIVQRACNEEDLNYTSLEKVSFDKDISPIFKSNCGVIGCHDQLWGENDYVFTNYESILKGVTPYYPNKSIAYRAVIGRGASLMPPGRALPEKEQKLIRDWIRQGAKKLPAP